ncbi:MAG: hypothetical protein ACI9GW_000957 [Halieaceae bacterium]|jgi:uncharacterized protein with von Willebrand factor type A (vWA) domain
MQSPLVSFINVLRSHDVRISPAETLDAMHALKILGYADREHLRLGLAATLAKTPAEKVIFDRCFDKYFAPANDAPLDTNPEADNESPSTDADSNPMELPENDDAQLENFPQLQSLLQSPLMQQLRDGETEHLAMDIARAAEQSGLSDIKMFTQKGIYTRKILDEMGEEQLRNAVIELENANSDLIQPVRYYRDALREQVRDYVERQYLLHAEGKNKQFMEDILSRAKLNNIEHRYLDRVHELVQKMARRLAHKHSRKRKVYRRGQLNMARTISRGIATDGVMFETFWKSTRRDKPQLLAICDVSGSVAAYSKFLLLFLYSLYEILPRVRSFAFSNHLGEVSELFEQYPVEQAVEMVNRKYGGATDYAGSFVDFARLAMDDINSNTTVIILGDARNNNGDPRLDILQSIYARARQVIWLNPESRQAWGSGDSEMRRYQSACHFTAECNSLQQLERVVDQLLKSSR